MKRTLLTLAAFGLVSAGCSESNPAQPTTEGPPVAPPALVGQIAFAGAGSDSVYHIYVLDLHRSTVAQLTSGTAVDQVPVWSPDRRTIAFLRWGDASTTGVWLMGADGSGPLRLSSHYGSPTWSPDGARIAILARKAMWVVKTDGSGETKVTDSLPGLWRYWGPEWSPDGTTIAFDGATLDIWGEALTQVYLMNANGSNLRRLTSDCTYGACGIQSGEAGPAWSPNGKMVAFFSSAFGITVTSRDGSGGFSVTKEGYAVTGEPPAETFGTEPDWSPDGDWLVFARNGQLVVTRADGSGAVHPVTSLPGGAVSPAWSR